MKAIAVGAVSLAILLSVSVLAVSLVSGQSESLCANTTSVATTTVSLLGDCDNLLRMKSELKGTADLNWWTGRSMGEWDGISIRDRRVDGVSLANSGLDGGVPSRLGDLSNLESLSLSSNNLSGQIPVSLNRLTSLSYLRLGGNNFTGCMPAKLLDVQDNDAASLNLPTCGSSTPTPVPTAVPTASPVPTATPTLTATPIPTATPLPSSFSERLSAIEARLSSLESRLTAVEETVSEIMGTPTTTSLESQ